MFLFTLTRTVGERSSDFGGVNVTEGRLSVLERPRGRELKEDRDEIGWDISINKRAYSICDWGCLCLRLTVGCRS